MTATVDFIIKRAVATRNAQESIQSAWVWEEKTLAQWDADLAAIREREKSVAEGEAHLLARRGPLDAALDDLHRRTLQGVTMAKVRAWYRAATVLFPKGTPEGDLIRGTVPTTAPPKPAAGPVSELPGS